jgi:uncharacterized membrane protein
MFDDQGIWHDEIYHQPQTGALAGLDILNQFQSAENFQRARAGQLLDNILKLRSQAGADTSQTPEGGQAMQTLGISPGSVQQLYAQTPEAQFRAEMRGIQGEPSLEQVTGAALRTGAETAPQATAAFARTLRPQAEIIKDAQTGVINAYKAAFRGNNSPQGAAQAAYEFGMANPYWKNHQEELANFVKAMPKELGGVEGARRDLLQAQEAVAEERGRFIHETLPGTITLQNARATAAYAASHVSQMRAEVLKKQSDGTLPASQAQLAADAIGLRRIITESRKIAANAPIPGAWSRQNEQDAQDAEKELKDIEARIVASAAAQGGAITQQPATPAKQPAAKGKAEERKGPHFASQAEFTKAFQTKYGHAPTEDDFKRARTAGLIP